MILTMNYHSLFVRWLLVVLTVNTFFIITDSSCYNGCSGSTPYCCDDTCSSSCKGKYCLTFFDCHGEYEYCCNHKCSSSETCAGSTCTTDRQCGTSNYCCSDGMCHRKCDGYSCQFGSDCGILEKCCGGTCRSTCEGEPCSSTADCDFESSCCGGTCQKHCTSGIVTGVVITVIVVIGIPTMCVLAGVFCGVGLCKRYSRHAVHQPVITTTGVPPPGSYPGVTYTQPGYPPPSGSGYPPPPGSGYPPPPGIGYPPPPASGYPPPPGSGYPPPPGTGYPPTPVGHSGGNPPTGIQPYPIGENPPPYPGTKI